MKIKKVILPIGLVLFVVFLIVAFAVPSKYTMTFWVAFLFTVISFVLNTYKWIEYFKINKDLNSKFLNIPILNVSYYYMIVQLVSFLVFKFAYMLPVWISIIWNALIIAFALIGFITISSASEYIQSVDEKSKTKVDYIKNLQADVELIATSTDDLKTKEMLDKLAEKIRFSDPVSNELLSDFELQIYENVELLKTAEKNDVPVIVGTIEKLITERNKKCKIFKQKE